MNKLRFLVMSMTIMIVAAMTPNAVAQQATQNVMQLEKDIEMHEKNIKEKEDAIKSLEEKIDDLKAQLKELESQKKTLEKEVKSETKMRKDKFTMRDDLVYDEEIADVLYNPYNKSDVEDALKSFEGISRNSSRSRKKSSQRPSGLTNPQQATFTRSLRKDSRAPSTGKSIIRKRKTRALTIWTASWTKSCSSRTRVSRARNSSTKR